MQDVNGGPGLPFGSSGFKANKDNYSVAVGIRVERMTAQIFESNLFREVACWSFPKLHKDESG